MARRYLLLLIDVLIISTAFAQTSHKSWWCANETYRGYDNGWYQELSTPDITLPDTPTGNLFFYFILNMNIEPPATYEEYDGWDGFNVRISTDGGATYEVIEPVDGYTCTSMYGFGYNGEGSGVPGWGGSSSGWTEKWFLINDYAGETVRFKFVFGSDPAACTVDGDGDPSWFGVLVDEVLVYDGANIYFYDDGGNTDDSELTPSDGQQAFWENFSTITTESHSGTNSAHSDNVVNKKAQLISPIITIPDGFLASISYWVYCDLPDYDGDDDGYLDDYYQVFISADSGVTWTYMTHDYARNSCATGWALWNNDSIFSGTLNLYDYIGQNIMIKFLQKNDDNDDGGSGSGLYIDDVCISGFYGNSYDAGASNVFASPINLGSDILFTVEVTGYGVEDVNPNVYYNIFDASADTSVSYGILGSATVGFGEQKYRSFTWHAGTEGDYYIVAWTVTGADEDNSNDSVRVDFTVPSEHYVELGFDDAVMDSFSGSYYYLTPGIDTIAEIGDGYGCDFEAPFDETHITAFWVKGAGTGNITFAIFEYSDIGIGFNPETTWTATLPDDGIDRTSFTFTLPEDYVVPFDSFVVAVWATDTESYFLDGIDMTAPHDGHSWLVDYEADYYDFLDMSTTTDPYNQMEFMIRCFVWDGTSDTTMLALSPGLNGHRFEKLMRTTETADIETIFFDDFEEGAFVWDTSYVPQIYWHITDDATLAYDDTGIRKSPRPAEFSLKQNTPNPFNPITEISFSLPEKADVSLVIYDISGHAVRELVSGNLNSGKHTVVWNGTDDAGNPLPSGIYFYKLTAGDNIDTKKMMLVR
ncbi:T9SS type A sorting domain-containing protein [bacterium]|nr:T9SS type A sorting domain-containing protein [bacterium]